MAEIARREPQDDIGGGILVEEGNPHAPGESVTIYDTSGEYIKLTAEEIDWLLPHLTRWRAEQKKEG